MFLLIIQIVFGPIKLNDSFWASPTWFNLKLELDNKSS